ncbi:hypothetical protein Aeqsu_0621 [Aequorivita sublithincola DSM 14238]|uniref:Uncharacterized protein n=1 Tax=Aequorivita sublithincola (strain DSM 14238 / LMG 21431 / ACAM 643 / 9-3) TaxID=746697 RepID=I3YT12_AEQSU|nr:DUF6090 family protein [Aequorivita sublithincola]AFL80130.1 hypothetical protein Aeqsu_0621 [Aequorivita sublithincola DSM 14238]
MIKLFRNIRKNLLAQGKTTKYLKYAIGEIILVVIGILIALSINNWNDIRKNQKYEQDILFLINQNLDNDSIQLTDRLLKAKEAIELTNRLVAQVATENYGDSLNFWMGKIITFERFTSQSSAFEVLKSKGIETISDNDLQLALISYYDEDLSGVYQALNDVEQSFKVDWFPVIKAEFSDFKWRAYCVPTDSKAFFQKASTLTFFNFYKDNRYGSVHNIELALEKISKIKNLSKKNSR